MGRSPCCEKEHTNKGAWTKEEDELLVNYIRSHGDGSWRSLPKAAGLQRCGKSCRLRWINYLRPDLKRGHFTKQEDDLIIHLHSLVGNKWSMIASRLPGRTDNEIKNYWNTHIKRKLISAGIDPRTHHPVPVVVRTSTSPSRSSNPSKAAAAAAASTTVSSSSSSNTSNTSLNNITHVVASKFELPLMPILTSSPATSITAAKPSSCSWNQQQQQQQHPPLPFTAVSEYSNSSGSSSSSSSALTSEELVLHSLLQPAGVQAQAQAEQPDLELSMGLPRRSASFRPYDFQKQHPAFGINNLQLVPNSTKTMTTPKGVCLCYRLGLEKSEAPSSSCNCRGTFPSRIRWW